MSQTWLPTIIMFFSQILIPVAVVVFIAATFVLVYKSYKLLKKIEEDMRYRR